jgi:putative toxin-antitoxin system, toxin component
MIENENTEDPVREKPTTGHELNSRDQNHEPADLGKAELWADILLGKYWNRKIPVDPNSIAVKMGIEVYFAPIPGGLAGAILKTRKEETPKIFVDNNASTSRKRFTIAHELGHCVERFRDSDSPNQKIPGCFGFSDESMVSDEKILGGIMPIGSRTPDQSPRELFADYFACCLLMPENEVQRFVGLGVNIDDVATHFGVSAATMRNRLNDLGIDL